MFAVRVPASRNREFWANNYKETYIAILVIILAVAGYVVVNVLMPRNFFGGREIFAKYLDCSITLMSGLYSTRPAPGVGMAVAALGAVEGLTRALALDLAPIRVNAVAPGVIDTPLWDSFGAQREAILARGATLPVGRIGRPEEVAAAVIFLMRNGFVTGAVLPIDGGGRLV
jgi:NAD(P)-dependent dehydrogenase (short-subunit alcohol dehydrogenase family)